MQDSTNLIDFHGASHGHFLEYIINSWIYRGNRVDKVFTNLGTCHLAQHDANYMKSRSIFCDHFTEYDQGPAAPEKLLRITIDTDLGRYAHMINLMYRAGDITLEKSYELIPEDVVNNVALLRNNWYSKFSDKDHGYNLDHKWKWQASSAFEFPMENLYNFFDLYRTIYDCANFLELRFSPDKELYDVWKQFIEGNQGFLAIRHCQKILENALSQTSFNFQTSVPEQALINVMLTKSVGIFDGPLFEENSYPNNSLDLWKHIDYFLKTFDSRF